MTTAELSRRTMLMLLASGGAGIAVAAFLSGFLNVEHGLIWIGMLIASTVGTTLVAKDLPAAEHSLFRAVVERIQNANESRRVGKLGEEA